MPSPDADRSLEVLDQAECRRLLGTAVIGRLAYTEGALPTIQPVHFALSGNRIVIPTRTGSKVAAASRGAVVAFEVDDFDPTTRTGWNVTVIGPSHVISDAAQVRALDDLGVRPWAAASEPAYIALQMTIVRGRQVFIDPPSASGGAGPRQAVLAR